MACKVIVTGKHTAETIQKFQSVPDCDIRFYETLSEIPEEDARDCELLLGGISREIVEKMPNLRFV